MRAFRTIRTISSEDNLVEILAGPPCSARRKRASHIHEMFAGEICLKIEFAFSTQICRSRHDVAAREKTSEKEGSEQKIITVSSGGNDSSDPLELAIGCKSVNVIMILGWY